MIIIYNGERQIYHPQNPNLKLVSPKLTLEDNAAGSLTFRVYDSNLNYNTIRKLHPVVSVVRDGETLFKGRVVSDKKDFYNGKSVEVEGKLAFFNDSYMEPFSFSGSPEELFRMIVENHNSQVMEWQQFKAGIVTVVDPNDYIVRSSENVINSWNALKDKCFKSSLGGHIRLRYEKDGDYIDWLADYDVVSKQNIEFAKNMIDMSLEVDATETYTAIRPVGAEVDGAKIDISSVNGGKTYIINEEKAAEYGIIFAPESESTWEDVTLPQNLLKKAKEKLFGSFVTLNETYEIKAVDLHLTDESIEALNICEYVPVVSRPHGINGNYLLSKAEICITEPQNSIFYLGSSKRVLSDMNIGGTTVVQAPKNISSFENDAGYISEEKTEKILSEYTKTEDVEEIVSQAVSQIPSGENGLSAYEIAVVYGFSGTEKEWLDSLKGKDAEGAYLPLTGGTLNSQIGFYPLILQQSIENSPGCGILFKNRNGIVGSLQFVSDSQSYAEARIFIRDSEGKDINMFDLSKERRKIYNSATQNTQTIITEHEVPFNFGTDNSGNYGYYKKDSTVLTPFGSGGSGEGAGADTDVLDKLNEILEMLGGFSFGHTEDGKAGFKGPDGDKFIAFCSCGGEIPDIPITPSGKTYNVNWIHSGTYNGVTIVVSGLFGINPSEIKTIKLNGGITGRSLNSTAGLTQKLYLIGTKIGASTTSNIETISTLPWPGSYNVDSTVNITDYVIDIDEDIDWTVWDKEKPIYLNYKIESKYNRGKADINIELQTKENSAINIIQNCSGYNYENYGYSYLTFYNPKLLSKIHLSGTLSPNYQTGYIRQQGCKIGSTSYGTIATIAALSSGSYNIDKDYSPVDWNTYDSEKGVRFAILPGNNSSKPGGISGMLTYSIE